MQVRLVAPRMDPPQRAAMEVRSGGAQARDEFYVELLRMGRIFKTEVPGQCYQAVLKAIPLLNDVDRRHGSHCQKCFRPLTARSKWWTYRRDLSAEAKRALIHLVPKAKDVCDEYMYCLCVACKVYYVQLGMEVVEVEPKGTVSGGGTSSASSSSRQPGT